VHCGIPVEHDEVPAAIRPADARTSPSSSTLAIFGWIMVGLGLLLVGGGAIALLYLG
jgi:hypothetical protein